MAIAAWRSGREGDESNLQALDELARLYEKAGQLEGLVEALTDKSHVIDDNVQRAALYLRIGTLKAGPLADLDGAAAAFREALDLQPEDGVALAAWPTSRKGAATTQRSRRRCCGSCLP